MYVLLCIFKFVVSVKTEFIGNLGEIIGHCNLAELFGAVRFGISVIYRVSVVLGCKNQIFVNLNIIFGIYSDEISYAFFVRR